MYEKKPENNSMVDNEMNNEENSGLKNVKA